MATDSDIIKLSNIISSKAAQLDGKFTPEDVSRPSSASDAPPSPFPADLAQTKAELLLAMDQMKALLQSPYERLVEIVDPVSINTMPAVEAVWKHQIPFNIKVGEELTYEELSERCKLNESDLRRVMRLLISKGIFTEPQTGTITHNSSSKILCDSSAFSDYLAFATKYIWASSFPTIDAMDKWPDGQELNETPFYLSHGETFWESMNKKDNARYFGAAMGFLKENPQFGSHHLIRDLEWDQTNCPLLMVDVGGHDGLIAAEILRTYPVGKCIVEDLPNVVAAAQIPEDLQGRLELKEHDFFTPQPITADVYLLRSICHDWSDKYASRIISNLIPALKPGARVIINEICMPDPGVIPKSMESMLRAYDLNMKQFFNSKERSIEEWDALFQSCDKRFKLARAKLTPGSALAVIEFVWEA